MEKYGHLQEQFEHSGGYTYETRIKQTLEGLGFESGDYHRALIQFSGGQKTRALLARLLLEAPDLLILDEPTNHLDIHAVEWLEKFLGEWHGSVLIVSHDRYFLDEVVNKVWEISATRMEEYNGNYSAFVLQRSERTERQRREYRIATRVHCQRARLHPPQYCWTEYRTSKRTAAQTRTAQRHRWRDCGAPTRT